MDGTGELLLDTAQVLERRFRVLRMRYEDEGRKGGADTHERLADTAREELEAVGVRRALVLAESFGGGVALQLALRSPELVRGLALVNTFAHFPRRVRGRLGAAVLPFVPRVALRRGRDLVGRHLFFRPRRDPRAEAAFLERATGFENAGFAARLAAVCALDLRERLGEISVPARLFASTRDRVLPSVQTMSVLRDGLPDARLELIEGANHIVLPLAEEPWLERLEELDLAASA